MARYNYSLAGQDEARYYRTEESGDVGKDLCNMDRQYLMVIVRHEEAESISVVVRLSRSFCLFVCQSYWHRINRLSVGEYLRLNNLFERPEKTHKLKDGS